MAFERGMTVEEIDSLTKIDPWFLRQLEEIAEAESAAGSGDT